MGLVGAHRRHWPVLLKLAQTGKERAKMKERWEDVDFEEEILSGLESYEYQEIADQVGLSARYVGEIMRGERVPKLKHWEAFAELAEG